MHNKPTHTIIWGNGLLGSALKKHEEEFKHLNLSIIAAGVSNSKHATDIDYNRESAFLENILSEFDNSLRNIVYISTFSVNDQSLKHEKYVRTRLNNEALIQRCQPNHTILRLTNIVGHNGNPTNILNFFNHSVKNNIPFQAWKNTLRNFVDAEDVGRFILWAEKNDNLKGSLELVHPISYAIHDIITALEKHHNTTARVEWLEKPKNTFPPNAYSKEFFDNHSIHESSMYLEELLKKYYPSSSTMP